MVLNNGKSYGKIIDLCTEMNEYTINLADLKPVKTVTLPRPYPSFLPYYLVHNIEEEFDINKVESIQFSIGPEIPETELDKPLEVGLVSMRFE